jgi:phosphopantothenoylcysteine decarboxylase/phosphopantothenate--cysteine ligase
MNPTDNTTPLSGRRLLLGITGGIAAYKSAELCRLLVKAGAEVRVAMTDAALEFIRPLTFQALTGQPVASSLFAGEAGNAMEHIELARWAELILVAPATADFLAKLAEGHADDLLLTVMLASRAPLAVAPAMNQAMWSAASTREAVAKLRQRQIRIWGPAEGEQACGDTGPGRMLEPSGLYDKLSRHFTPGAFTGRKLLITAGPTREAIDPVRFLSNRSSGKMGYALAEAAREAGAEVTLVSGPVCLETPFGVERISVLSAGDMRRAVLQALPGTDVFIAAAAVADYRPISVADEKIKKSAETLSLELERTPDILAEVAARPDRPWCVGFAAETRDLADYALDKLRRKQLDMIAANRVDGEQGAFDSDDNELSVFWADGAIELPRQPKAQIARELIAIIADQFSRRRAQPD